jgi:magnesium chelatase family protein
VEFLRSEENIGPRKQSAADSDLDDVEASDWLQGRPIAQRLMQVCAAGSHPMLCFGGPARQICEDLLPLLPSLAVEVKEEAESLQRLTGETVWRRPLRELRADQAGRLLRFDSKAGIFGEISLAHGGLLFISSLGDRPLALMRQLQEPVESGTIRSFRAGHPVQMPADWQLVAQADLCLCGVKGACNCASHEVLKWRQRLDQIRPLFPIAYHFEEPGEGRSFSFSAARGRVEQARSMALKRQRLPNNRLGLGDCLKAKPWSEEAVEVWKISRSTRVEHALARVALTVSDLRAGERIEKRDMLEARYYVPEPFVARSRSGNSF